MGLSRFLGSFLGVFSKTKGLKIEFISQKTKSPDFSTTIMLEI
jgi:hypothetical protein